MIASGPDGRNEDWKNVECENCGLLLEGDPTDPDDGDPRPEPLAAPFVQQGDDVVIVCE